MQLQLHHNEHDGVSNHRRLDFCSTVCWGADQRKYSSASLSNFKGHAAKKIVDFDPNWAFPDCISSLNSQMALKWCIKIEVPKKRCPVVFQGYPSNFKVTRLKKSSILTQIGSFRTVTPVWIPHWLWNGAQRLKQHRRGTLLFFKVIRQFSRSSGQIIANFDPNWAFRQFLPGLRVSRL